MSHAGDLSETDLSLLTPCALPGCRTLVAEAGDVCDGCRDAFGPMLVQTDRPRLTAEQLHERDRVVAEAYFEQQRLTVLATQDAAGEVKSNQLCWLCEQRRRCTRVDGRWECRECGTVPPAGAVSAP